MHRTGATALPSLQGRIQVSSFLTFTSHDKGVAHTVDAGSLQPWLAPCRTCWRQVCRAHITGFWWRSCDLHDVQEERCHSKHTRATTWSVCMFTHTEKMTQHMTHWQETSMTSKTYNVLDGKETGSRCGRLHCFGVSYVAVNWILPETDSSNYRDTNRRFQCFLIYKLKPNN